MFLLLAIHLVSGLSNEVDHTLVSLYHALLGLNSIKKVKTGLVYNPLTRCLVLNGLPGHLQFFDVKLLKVKSQVCNYIWNTYSLSLSHTDRNCSSKLCVTFRWCSYNTYNYRFCCIFIIWFLDDNSMLE